VRSASKEKKTGGEEEVNRVISLRGDVKYLYIEHFIHLLLTCVWFLLGQSIVLGKK
jgi:hypothetical protein